MKKKIILLATFLLMLGLFNAVYADAAKTTATSTAAAVVKEEPIAVFFDTKVYDPMGQMLVDNIKSAFKKDKDFTLVPRFGCPYLSIHISTMAFEGRDGKVCAYSEVINFVPLPDPSTGNEVYPWYIGGTVGVCSMAEISGDAKAVYENVKKILDKHKDITLALRLPVAVNASSSATAK